MEDVRQRRWFDLYIDALNRGDLDRVAACYAPDLQVADGQIDLHGAAEMLGFHRQFNGRVVQTWDVLGYVDRPGRIAAEIRSTLVALTDVPDYPGMPLNKGERRSLVSFAMYDIADDRFIRIRSAPSKAAS